MMTRMVIHVLISQHIGSRCLLPSQHFSTVALTNWQFGIAFDNCHHWFIMVLSLRWQAWDNSDRAMVGVGGVQGVAGGLVLSTACLVGEETRHPKPWHNFWNIHNYHNPTSIRSDPTWKKKNTKRKQSACTRRFFKCTLLTSLCSSMLILSHPHPHHVPSLAISLWAITSHYLLIFCTEQWGVPRKVSLHSTHININKYNKKNIYNIYIYVNIY